MNSTTAKTIPTARENMTQYTQKFATNSETESRVLVLYTGGTIGMMKNHRGVLAPNPNALERKIRGYQHMHDIEYALERFGSEESPLVMPKFDDDLRKRIIYSIYEYDPLLDSSDMGIKEWSRIASDIKHWYETYDGFVILHGTDTLSYTASALSFVLENLGKPVILTGAQIPIFETRSDGRDNFLSALIMAGGGYNIAEVCVFFGHKLYRGNRTVKTSCEALQAFTSPNYPALAEMSISVEIDRAALIRPKEIERLSVHTNLNPNVGLLRIFPGMSGDTIRSFLRPPVEGIVLQTFGAGNIPCSRNELVAALAEASERGVLIVNITQCAKGSVSEVYETGRVLRDCGVISGVDMTPEAALCKLSYVLSKPQWDQATRRIMMSRSLRGELTEIGEEEKEDLIDTVARCLRVTTKKQRQALTNILYPAMLNNAVLANDVERLEDQYRQGADFTAVDTEARTCLHVACANVDVSLDVVKCLLRLGANVHARDVRGRTPLRDAVDQDRHEVVRVLRKAGAHLVAPCGQDLVMAAEKGSLIRLEGYRLAGADLAQPDSSGRTAAHAAALHGRRDVIEYLLRHGVSTEDKDMLGMTPNDYTKLVRKRSLASMAVVNCDHRNGDYDNGNFRNGDYKIGSANGDNKNGSSNGDYKNGATNGDYKNGATNGDYKNGSSNGDYKNGSYNGDYNNGSSNGDYKNGSSNGDYKNGSTNGDYNNGSSYGDYKNGSSNGDYKNGSSNGGYNNGSSNGDYKNGATNGDYKNGSSNGVYKNGSSNGDYKNGSSNGDYKNGTANGY